MKYTALGRTGMQVSRFCLGTTNFGNVTDEKEARRIMDAAIDAGINYFDTANEYGGGHKGITETIIGRWFQDTGKRKKVIMQTKAFSWMADSDDPINEEAHGLSTYKLRRNLEDSLKRLQTDHIEVYMMHHYDRGTSWDELYECYQSMLYQGKIDYLGSSNSAGYDLCEAQMEAKKRNILGVVVEEHRYNLMCRLPELELLPAAQKLGIGTFAYSPLNAGVLAGKSLHDPTKSRRIEANVIDAEHPKAPNYMNFIDMEPQLAKFAKLCDELGETQANVAVAWLLSRPNLTGVIVGPRTVEQFEAMLPAMELTLPDDFIKEMDLIFPGPGGGAPEAYAW
ncbi:aldo/keto reductase [Zongyangia hominis]|uniref:Aldo/keto reductase n=1 Tax=Zongyangia hominis TaxID=2763677 RepID=A0A926EB17_9FIRM|nr:aldo/keto reductase [Zongyangia hominis]MBC8571235.1 aldo/keto reductase [Zongyangia hominis]